MRTGACLLWSATKRRQHIQVFADDGVSPKNGENSNDATGRPLEISSGSGEVHLAYALQQLLGVQQRGQRSLTDLAIEKLPLLPPTSSLALVYATASPEIPQLRELVRLIRARRLHASFVFIAGHTFSQVSRWPVSEEEAAERVQTIRALLESEGFDALFLDSEHQLREALTDWRDIA